MASLFKRGRVYWLKYHQNGRTVRESTGTRKERVALKILKLRDGDLAKGIHIDPKAGKITFPDAMADVERDYTVNGRRSAAHVARRVKEHLAPFFGQRRMTQIDTALIRSFIEHRQTQGAANASINRELAILKRGFALAMQAGKLHSKPHVPMLKENNARRGFFERAQFEAVCKKLRPELRAVVKFDYIPAGACSQKCCRSNGGTSIGTDVRCDSIRAPRRTVRDARSHSRRNWKSC